MLYPIKFIEGLQELNELVSLENQVKVVRLQDKLGEQNYHHDRNKLLEAMTDAIKNTSQDITKTITETSIKNSKKSKSFNEKNLDLLNDKGMITHTLAYFLVNLFKPENKSQFRIKKDFNSARVNDFLINGGVPVSIYDNMLTLRDSNRSFELDGDLSETRTSYDSNLSNSIPKDRKLIHEFGKEMNFKFRQQGRKSDRDKSMRKLLKSTAIIVSGVTTKFLPGNPDELCNRLKLLLQEKQAGNNSNKINDDIVAIVDKLLEYKCITKKQQKHNQIKC